MHPAVTVLLIVLANCVFVFLLGLVIYSWQTARHTVLPKRVTKEYEIKWNKDRNLWLDFDSYLTKDYTVEGKDGYILHATYVYTKEVQGTGKYVIICHGRTSSRYGGIKYVNSYIKLGFSCIIYDARGHGDNAPAKCTLGYVESEDLYKVIQDTRNKFSDVKVLGLQGESMGSSTAIHVLRFHPNVDFIVSDCGFMDVCTVTRDCYRKVFLHHFVPCINFACKLIYKIDIRKTNALKYLEGNKTPILFIHGSGDTFIRPYQSEVLRNKAAENGAYTELIFVEGAGHARSRVFAGFEKYTGYIENFLKNIGIT